MTDRKPRWKRKRWIAVLVLWLVLAYPLSHAAVWYGIGRGWLSIEAGISPAWAPISWAWDAAALEEWDPDSPAWIGYPAKAVRLYSDFCFWCGQLGHFHRTSD